MFDEAGRRVRSDVEVALTGLLWEGGDLSYFLHAGQEELRSMVRESPHLVDIILASRRWGKSWLAVVEVIESCVKSLVHGTERERHVVAAQTQKEAEGIVAPHFDAILADCPPRLMPRENKVKLRWTFGNGSVIQLAGTDGRNRERLRGRGANSIWVDEAGFHDDFEYLIQSVLMPQGLYQRSVWMKRRDKFLRSNPGATMEEVREAIGPEQGKIVMLSTPSRSPSHPFVSRYCVEAEGAGRLPVRTIYDAPHIHPEAIELFKKQSGGTKTTTWKREYLCKRIVDEERAVVPEFSALEHLLVEDTPRPEWFDTYVIGDGGFEDMFAVGFWEYYPTLGIAQLVDELVFTNQGTAEVCPTIREREVELWGELRLERTKHRVDLPPISRRDMAIHHGQSWAGVPKVDKFGAVNTLRVAVGRVEDGPEDEDGNPTEELAPGWLRFSPKATHTRAHMRAAIWNQSRQSFERSGEFGHFDFVDMAKYFVRCCDRTSQAGRPAFPRVDEGTHHVPRVTTAQGSAKAAKIAGALLPRRKKRRR